MTRRRDSEEKRSFWRMAIQMQRESELPIAEFCRREGLSPASFYSWRRKLEQEADSKAPDQKAPNQNVSSPQARLAPVHVVEDQVALDVRHDIVEVASPAGFVLRVHDDATSDNVRRVLQLMHELS